MSLTRREFFRLRPAHRPAPQDTLPATPDAPTGPRRNVDPIAHLLNRLTYGPRPEEMARARQIGFTAFLDEQLAPETLDDRAMDAQLAKETILTMDRRTVHKLGMDSGRVYRTLAQAMVQRAVHSRRQLLERMVEFWSDHFNVSGDDFVLDMVAYQQQIRRHALGVFRDLLIATAKAPAMLYYLDNFINVAEHPNENYARELLELHTLGVDGGYTERDVKEVARAFTGWRVHNRQRDGFYFDPAVHDTGAKSVLGHALPAGRGLEDGVHVLSICADHPATRRFVCRKLCVRFVSDNPPASLVDAMSATWEATDGEIRAVLRTLFLSVEFGQAVGLKFRRPLDFYIGALRATGTQVDEFWTEWEMLGQLGQPVFGWHPPNGYPDVGAAWMSASGLLARWNSAMRLTHSPHSDKQNGEAWGLRARLNERIEHPATVGDLVDQVAAQVWGEPLSGADRAYFIEYVAEGAGEERAADAFLLGRKLASLFGLMLASPLFQWR